MADLSIPDEIREVIADVRNDKSDTNFVVVSFEDETKQHTLKLLSQGSNGVDGLRDGLIATDACYGLLRVDFQFEKVGNVTSSGTRFIFIFLRPESLPLKRKMMLGSVEGKVKKLFSPFMKNLEIDAPEVLSQEKIQGIIDEITMTKDKTTEKKAVEGFFVGGVFHKAENEKSVNEAERARTGSLTWFSPTKTTGAIVNFDDEEKLAEEMAKVRSDKDDTNYCIFSYKDKKTIEFIASGSEEDSVEAVLSAMPEDNVSYALFRVLENYSAGRNEKGEKTVKIDTYRFGFIVFVPEGGSLSPSMKAVVSTHKGAVVKKFRPFSHQWFLGNKAELTMDQVMETFMKISGVKSNVTDRKAVKKEEKFERKFVGGNTGKVQELQFHDKDAILEAIADVRKDSHEAIFVLASFSGDRKNLALKYETSGLSIEELLKSLRDDAIMYGLLRQTAIVDGYDTTRFTLFKFEGPDVSITFKGAAGVYHGAVIEVFGQSHSYVACANVAEVEAKLTI